MLEFLSDLGVLGIIVLALFPLLLFLCIRIAAKKQTGASFMLAAALSLPPVLLGSVATMIGFSAIKSTQQENAGGKDEGAPGEKEIEQAKTLAMRTTIVGGAESAGPLALSMLVMTLKRTASLHSARSKEK